MSQGSERKVTEKAPDATGQVTTSTGDFGAQKTNARQPNSMRLQNPKNCTTCEEPTRSSDGHWHHIVPRSLGGSESYGNLIFVCIKCHGLIHGRHTTNHTELVRAGLKKAKESGVKFGAPVKLTDEIILKIKKCRSEKMSISQISDLLQISVGSVDKGIKIYKAKAAASKALVLAGLQKAKERGVQLGAPVKLTDEIILKIKKCRSEKMSIRQISALLKVSVGSVSTAINMDKKKAAASKAA